MLISPGMFDKDYDPEKLKKEAHAKKIKESYAKARSRRKKRKK